MVTQRNGRKPEGYWMGIGMAICVPIGMVMFTAMGRQYLPIGVGVGAGIGVSIGAALEQRQKADLRPLAPAEAQTIKWLVLAGVGILVALVAIRIL